MIQRLRYPSPQGDVVADIDHGPRQARPWHQPDDAYFFFAMPLTHAQPVTSGLGKTTSWAERQPFTITGRPKD